jgi:hypothetical protein
MTDGEPGLQVKPRDGDWMDVPHVDGAYVVNIGDCLMRWTNDIYVSTPHRVSAAETAAPVGRHVRGGASRRHGGGAAGHRRAEIRADPRGGLSAEPPRRDL